MVINRNLTNRDLPVNAGLFISYSNVTLGGKILELKNP